MEAGKVITKSGLTDIEGGDQVWFTKSGLVFLEGLSPVGLKLDPPKMAKGMCLGYDRTGEHMYITTGKNMVKKCIPGK